MHSAELEVIGLFRKQPNTELSTSEIIQAVDEKYKKILDVIKNSPNKEAIKKAKKERGQIHRKILYHLNKLVEDEILRVSRILEKGEKCFRLALEEGEELVIRKSRKRIVLTKPSLPAMPIEGYEHKKIIQKFEEATWCDRLNAVLLESTMFSDLDKFYSVIENSFSCINDVMALHNFEHIIENHSAEDVAGFLKKVKKICEEFGKKISCTISVSNITNSEKIIEFIRRNEKDEDMIFIFDVRNHDMQEHANFLIKLIDLFSSSRQEFYIKNQDLHPAPYFLGRAGPYTFDDKEWRLYEKELQGKIYGLSCAQSSVAVDVHKFLKEHGLSISQFRLFITNIAKSLLSVNALQRRKAEEYFKYLVKLNGTYAKEFFGASHNYIRFWNYGWKEPNFDQDLVISMIENTRKAVDDFSIAEETIYKACGMPTRFRVTFSCVSRELASELFSKEQFHKLNINKLEDLYSKEIKDILSAKEQIFQVFSGGDRVSFHHSESIVAKDIFRELSVILNTYKLPFFCFDFSGMKGMNLKLDTFIDKMD